MIYSLKRGKNMKKCPICGIENEEQFTFCSQCGEKLDDKIHCPSCNELIQKNSVFCGFCGAKIKDKKRKAKRRRMPFPKEEAAP